SAAAPDPSSESTACSGNSALKRSRTALSTARSVSVTKLPRPLRRVSPRCPPARPGKRSSRMRDASSAHSRATCSALRPCADIGRSVMVRLARILYDAVARDQEEPMSKPKQEPNVQPAGVEETLHSEGIGTVELWTVAESSGLAGYAETRAFYRALGFIEHRIDTVNRTAGGYDRLFLRKSLGSPD